MESSIACCKIEFDERHFYLEPFIADHPVVDF